MPMWSIGDDRRHHMLATLASTGRPCARLKVERLPQDCAITRRSPSIMRVAGTTALVTCPNRGIGKARGSGVTTKSSAAATAAALTATLGLPAVAWVTALRLLHGMDMGVATGLGSFGFFVALWVSMMAAM